MLPLLAGLLSIYGFNFPASAEETAAEMEASICQPLHGVPPSSPAGQISAGRIIGVGPVRMVPILPRCEGSQPDCVQPNSISLAAGSLAGVTGSKQGFSCIQYGDKRRGNIAGWVLSSHILALKTNGDLPLRTWTGLWKMDDNSIRITAETNGGLHAVGDAVYQARTGPNFGSFDERGRAVRGKIDFASEGKGCGVSMALIGEMLAVFDTGDCDGMNVSFTGIYVHK
jgi:hypothetical protein